MKHEDIKDLTNYLQFKEIPQGENVVTYGEHGETYYIIIKGVCGIKTPNPTIKDWNSKYNDYQTLLKWKAKGTF